MKISKLLLAIAFVCAFGVASLASAGTARADEASAVDELYDGKLHINFTPYVWAPTINASLRHPLAGITGPNGQPIVPDPTQTFDTQIGPNNYLAKLNFALMGTFSARIGNLALFNDVINLNAGSTGTSTVRNIGNTTSTLASTAQGQLVTTLWTVAPTYTVYHDKGTMVDVLAGAQTIWVTSNGNLQVTGPMGNTFTGGFRNADTYSLFVFGTLGQVGLGGKLSLPFFVAYGGVSHPISVDWLAGLKYGKTSLSWRSLQVDSGNPTALIQRLNLSGPMLGYTFSF